MRQKIILFYQSLGFLGLLKVLFRAGSIRGVSLLNRGLYFFGFASLRQAKKIVASQSPDESVQSLIRFWFPLILNSKTDFAAVVPNYLGPAFKRIHSFVSPKSEFLTYEQASQSSRAFDWLMIQQGILGLLANSILPHLNEYRVVYSKFGFYLLSRSQAIPEVLSPTERHEFEETVRQLAGSDEYGIIERHGMKYKVRLKTIDKGIVDEVYGEYVSWFWPEIKNLKKVVDIGAQIGAFTTQITQFLDMSGKVYAFEPEPENFKLLTENIRLNALESKVEVISAAVSDRDGEATLSISSDNTGGNKLGVPEASSTRSAVVKTIDALAFFERLGKVDLLKIDVEGWEYPILKCLQPKLKDIRYLIGELQRSDVGNPEDSLALLRGEGFEVETKGDPHQLLFRASKSGF